MEPRPVYGRGQISSEKIIDYVEEWSWQEYTAVEDFAKMLLRLTPSGSISLAAGC